ncbi:MAG: Fe-S cluster assembly ATPase SufC [Alphaproteobacteria bacterium]|nr:Fe-S cluster assembly ATPase SufC [Alphaproteobacteria bacterium]
MQALIDIRNLHVSVDNKPILKGVNLAIYPGEIHALMGPNGSGKSTLSYVLTGRSGYDVTEGQIFYKGQDLLALSIEERARAGVFLAFQYPIEIAGVGSNQFLRAALNAVRLSRNLPELGALEFLNLIKEKQKKLGIHDDMMRRSVNAGFSGGEKKRYEILQMALLEPSFAILDETDSGLDIDALKTVSEGVNSLKSPDKSILVITHYQRLLDYIIPDKIHILADGQIIKSGDKNLALALEQEGYAPILKENRKGAA